MHNLRSERFKRAVLIQCVATAFIFIVVGIFAYVTRASYAQESKNSNKFKNMAATKQAAMEAARHSPPVPPRDIKMLKMNKSNLLVVVCADNTIWSIRVAVDEPQWSRLPAIPGR